jgi:hypothetical protein
MKLDRVLEVRDEWLSDFDSQHGSGAEGGPQTEGAVASAFDRRLAAGFSIGGKENCRVEIRVQRKSGPAWAFAENLKEKYPDDVNVELVGTVFVPPSSDVKKKGAALIDQCPRLCPGLSVCHRDTRAGTIGMMVELKKGPALLSAAHVIAKSGNAEKNDPIYHPGKPDIEPLGLEYRVAKLAGAVDLTEDDLNQIDAAVGILNDDVDFTNALPNGVSCAEEGKILKKVLTLQELAKLGPEPFVCKVGRTTGYTMGRLTALDVKRLPVRTPRGNYAFGGILEVSWTDGAFSRPGDSGSVVYVASPLAGIGLHFASDGESKSYACLLEKVLDYFKATPVDC